MLLPSTAFAQTDGGQVTEITNEPNPWYIVTSIAALATAIATMVFVILMSLQVISTNKEHSITLRPIIVARDSIKYTESGGSIQAGYLDVTLYNAGNVHSGRARIFALPLDTYDHYATRKDALKKYVKLLGKKQAEDNRVAMVMNPSRERMKRTSRYSSFEKYIVVGEDLKKLRPAWKEFEAVLDRVDDRDAFNKAGRDRLASMESLNDEDWNKFYQTGTKRGDILDVAGPVDWENFDTDGSINEAQARELLGDDADTTYGDAPARKKIVDSMSEENRRRFMDAIKRRQDIWNRQPADVTRDFGKTSINLRRVYKSVKDVSMRTASMMVPENQMSIRVPVTVADLEIGRSGEYAYFGVVVQYSRPGKDDLEYTYYLQGYLKNKAAHIDYTLNLLD